MATIKLEMLLKYNSLNEEILECIIDKKSYSINFTSENQNLLRSFFLAVLNKLKDSEVEFVYKKDNAFNNQIFEEVAQEYIKGLNAEILSIKKDIEEINFTNKS